VRGDNVNILGLGRLNSTRGSPPRAWGQYWEIKDLWLQNRVMCLVSSYVKTNFSNLLQSAD
jgi:hypothetical protein